MVCHYYWEQCKMKVVIIWWIVRNHTLTPKLSLHTLAEQRHFIYLLSYFPHLVAMLSSLSHLRLYPSLQLSAGFIKSCVWGQTNAILFLWSCRYAGSHEGQSHQLEDVHPALLTGALLMCWVQAAHLSRWECWLPVVKASEKWLSGCLLELRKKLVTVGW